MLERLDEVRLVVPLKVPPSPEGSPVDGCSKWVGCNSTTVPSMFDSRFVLAMPKRCGTF